MEYTDTYELIEAYLQGEMPKEEKLKFEQNLRTDPELFKEYQYHKLANDTLIKDRLNNLNKTLKKRTKQKAQRKKLVIGFVLLACILFGLYVFLKNNKEPNNKSSKNDYPLIIEVSNETQHIKEEIGIVKPPELKDNNTHHEKVSVPINNDQIKKDSIPRTENSNVLNKVDSSTYNLDTLILNKNLNTIDLEISKEQTKEIIDTIEQSIMDSIEVTSEDTLMLVPEKVYLEISPLYDLYDEFPFQDNVSGVLYIYTKRGDLIKKMYIEDSEPSYWDGKDDNGSVTPGYYVFKFESLSNNLLMGGITVIY